MNTLLLGDLKDHIKTGFKIIGPNLSNGELCTWHSDSEQDALRLATHFCECCGGSYEIIKYEFIGVVRPVKFPTEYVKPDLHNNQ